MEDNKITDEIEVNEEIEQAQEETLITMTADDFNNLVDNLTEKGRLEQVPLNPAMLNEESYFDVVNSSEFVKGVSNVKELLGELAAVATFGITPHRWIEHKEQMSAIESGVKISKNVKKNIEEQVDENSM